MRESSSVSERDVGGEEGRGGGSRRGGRGGVDEGAEGRGSSERVGDGRRENDVEFSRRPDTDEDSEGGNEFLEAEKERSKEEKEGSSADASFTTKKVEERERGEASTHCW